MAPKPVPSADEVAYKAAAEGGFVPSSAHSPLGVVSDGENPLNEKKGEVTDTTGYIGVSGEYMTYSSDLLKPYAAEGGVEEIREKRYAEAVQTNVAKVPDPRENKQQQGVSTYETLSTAASGKGLNAELTDAPKFEYDAQVNRPKTPVTPEVEKAETEEPASPAAPKSPATPSN